MYTYLLATLALSATGLARPDDSMPAVSVPDSVKQECSAAVDSYMPAWETSIISAYSEFKASSTMPPIPDGSGVLPSDCVQYMDSLLPWASSKIFTKRELSTLETSASTTGAPAAITTT
ncbi:MAG: hypothetical protein M1820_010692 [Bogoriella megaspora]|nr:MAG: hypothetical protein M1820_010692 [Bogoriella megaspora]